ncbi:MAG: protein kinase [Deltaproteobacteria bacterium]|nr:protein kinase [Deltaproteobacteria bacterium]
MPFASPDLEPLERLASDAAQTRLISDENPFAEAVAADELQTLGTDASMDPTEGMHAVSAGDSTTAKKLAVSIEPETSSTDTLRPVELEDTADGAKPRLQDALVGTVVHGFRFGELIGEGRWTRVYRGEHTVLPRVCAIKVVKEGLGHATARLLRETTLLGKVQHPHLVSVLDCGKLSDGRPFMCLELLAGQTLGAELLRGPIPVARAARIARQLAQGLEEAHRHGVVHRDLRPKNVMVVGGEGEVCVKIFDFGLVTENDELAARKPSHVAMLAGPSPYLAPELRGGARATSAADLYSLGAVLYHMLAGQAPPRALDATAQKTNLPRFPPLPASGGLESIAMSLLADAPASRMQPAAKVIEAIDALALGGARPASMAKRAKSAPILLVDSDERNLDLLRATLREHSLLVARTAAEADEVLAREKPAVALIRFDPSDPSIIELLQRCAEAHRQVKLLVQAEHGALSELIRADVQRLASVVLPFPVQPEKLRKAADRLLQIAESEARFRDAPDGSTRLLEDWQAGETLLWWTVSRAGQVTGRIVRDLADRPGALEVQLVLPLGIEYDRLLSDLRHHWGEPLKAAGKSLPFNRRRHPAAVFVGKLEKAQSLSSVSVDGRDIHLYLLVLPWRREPKATLVLGVLTSEDKQAFVPVLRSLKEGAVRELSQVVLPQTGPVQPNSARYIAEYDLVATRSYVGPDRRQEPTPLLNKFMFRGSRQRVPTNLLLGGEQVVDRLTRKAWVWFAAYAALSVIDTIFTFLHVRSGLVRELNPVLRWPLQSHPWLFFALKNLFALSAFAAVSRFQIHKVGRFLIPAVVGAYVVLDLYWLRLLFWP